MKVYSWLDDETKTIERWLGSEVTKKDFYLPDSIQVNEWGEVTVFTIRTEQIRQKRGWDSQASHITDLSDIHSRISHFFFKQLKRAEFQKEKKSDKKIVVIEKACVVPLKSPVLWGVTDRSLFLSRQVF